jgi:hypothetical protein
LANQEVAKWHQWAANLEACWVIETRKRRVIEARKRKVIAIEARKRAFEFYGSLE